MRGWCLSGGCFAARYPNYMEEFFPHSSEPIHKNVETGKKKCYSLNIADIAEL